MESTHKTKGWKKRYFIYLFFLIILILACITNPNEEAHKNALKARAHSIMSEIVTEQRNTMSSAVWQLGGSQLVDGFIDSNLSIDNYYLFSIPKIRWNEKSYPIGFGAFSKVYITKELNKAVIQPIIEDMENKITDSLPDFLNF